MTSVDEQKAEFERVKARVYREQHEAMLAYMAEAKQRTDAAYERGFEAGLKTHWRWRLYFWLRDRYALRRGDEHGR